VKGSKHLSIEDPFEGIGEDTTDEAQTGPDTTVVKPAAVGDGEGKIVLTFKEGAGYDASWVVVHAESVADGIAILADKQFGDLLARTKKIAAFFSGGSTAQAASNGGGGGAPAASQEAPGGEKRYCSHGEMVYRSGVSKKSGNAYKMFACPSPDRNGQCKAQFL